MDTSQEIMAPAAEQFFFTITMHPDLLPSTIKTQLMKSYGKLYRVLKQLFTRFETVYEFTLKGNIHYHGVFFLPVGDDYMLTVFQDLIKGYPFGFNKINKVIKDHGISDYMMKSFSSTKRICNKVKVNLDAYPILYNQDSYISSMKFKPIPLNVLQTTNLDILAPIDEEAEFDEYMAYNYQLK